ncbi:hypothetical protein SOVF_113440 [Spinacia oleracea]|nr:hypothetical protein SOVF_113440 [Spinacia oleracea]
MVGGGGSISKLIIKVSLPGKKLYSLWILCDENL